MKAWCAVVSLIITLCTTGLRISFAEDLASELCKTKMQILYNATMEYVKENNGFLPPAYAQKETETSVKGKNMWFTALSEYLVKWGERVEGKYVAKKKQAEDTLFVCPSNPYWYGGFGPGCGNYAWNDNLGVIYQRPGEKVTVAIKPVRLADLLDPSHTILLVDAASVERKGDAIPIVCEYHATDKQGIGFWHKKRANVLFADGHIETLSREDIKDEWFQVKTK